MTERRGKRLLFIFLRNIPQCRSRNKKNNHNNHTFFLSEFGNFNIGGPVNQPIKKGLTLMAKQNNHENDMDRRSEKQAMHIPMATSSGPGDNIMNPSLKFRLVFIHVAVRWGWKMFIFHF
jgi:hypothetical protein